MTMRFNRWLPLLLLLFAVPFWWYLLDTGRDQSRAKPVHIAQLRLLADSIPGPHPTALTYTVLATRSEPGDLLAAGIGLKSRPLGLVAWTLPVPGRPPILIDPGPVPRATIGRFARIDHAGVRSIAAQAQSALVLAMQVGGGAASAMPAPRGRTGMFAVAAAPIPPARAGGPPTAQAVAPGVVTIDASGHAPGARMIFVQLADGRELLFTGTIAALTENWTQLRARSRLAEEWGPPQDRGETYAWLRTIRQLRNEAPRLGIIPANDYNWLMKQRNFGIIAQTPATAAPPSPAGGRNLRGRQSAPACRQALALARGLQYGALRISGPGDRIHAMVLPEPDSKAMLS